MKAPKLFSHGYLAFSFLEETSGPAASCADAAGARPQSYLKSPNRRNAFIAAELAFLFGLIKQLAQLRPEAPFFLSAVKA
jgi:hypothetical protein